jgi:O-antigen ligase
VGVLIPIIRGSRDGLASGARRALVTIGGLAAALLLAGAIAWGAAGNQIRPRYEEAVREVRAALNTRDYSTFTGARLAMWEWAYAAWRCHPVVGVGAGGYQAWVQEQARLRAIADPRACAHSGPTINGGAQVHHHAHGLVPQVAATTGMVGLAILGGLMLTSIGGSVRSLTRRARGDGAAPNRGGYLSAGPALGLAGLLAAGLFDSITVNQQTWYIASLLLALVVTCAPELRRPVASPPATPR